MHSDNSMVVYACTMSYVLLSHWIGMRKSFCGNLFMCYCGLHSFMAETASHFTCKCKEQEREISSSTPRWDAWLSFGYFTSYWSSFWAAWCPIQFHEFFLSKSILPDLVGTIGWLRCRRCSPEKETLKEGWACTVEKRSGKCSDERLRWTDDTVSPFLFSHEDIPDARKTGFGYSMFKARELYFVERYHLLHNFYQSFCYVNLWFGKLF